MSGTSSRYCETSRLRQEGRKIWGKPNSKGFPPLPIPVEECRQLWDRHARACQFLAEMYQLDQEAVFKRLRSGNESLYSFKNLVKLVELFQKDPKHLIILKKYVRGALALAMQDIAKEGLSVINSQVALRIYQARVEPLIPVKI